MQSLYKMAFSPPWAIFSSCMLTLSLLRMFLVCLSIRHHGLLWLGKKLVLLYKTYANDLLGHRVSSFVLLSITFIILFFIPQYSLAAIFVSQAIAFPQLLFICDLTFPNSCLLSTFTLLPSILITHFLLAALLWLLRHQIAETSQYRKFIRSCSVTSVRIAHEQSTKWARPPEGEPVSGADLGQQARDLMLAQSQEMEDSQEQRVPRNQEQGSQERCAPRNGT
jgi:hypothetical protein